VQSHVRKFQIELWPQTLYDGKSSEQCVAVDPGLNGGSQQLLSESLGRDPHFEIVTAATPGEILPVVTNLQPDLVLISADFEGAAKKGLQVARNLKSRNPSVGIVIILETSTRESVIATFRCGATAN
jgi:DNA-binding NarL/FixJ family response regulator